MRADYVADLNRAYNHFFFHYAETPLLVVNSSTVDLAGDERAFSELVRQVDELQGGTRYYMPTGARGPAIE